MYSIHRAKPMALFLIVSLAALLAFTLAACGSGARPASTATPTPTTIQGYGTAHGCPSDAVVTAVPPAAQVIVKRADAHAPIKAHVGDVIEIQLPFGQKWIGPLASVGGLQLHKPAGYAWPATKMCIWRFTAQRAGITQLTFSARAICKQRQPCPRFVMIVTFTIVVN